MYSTTSDIGRVKIMSHEPIRSSRGLGTCRIFLPCTKMPPPNTMDLRLTLLPHDPASSASCPSTPNPFLITSPHPNLVSGCQPGPRHFPYYHPVSPYYCPVSLYYHPHQPLGHAGRWLPQTPPRKHGSSQCVRTDVN